MHHFALKCLSLCENVHIKTEKDMIANVKKYLLHLLCVVALLGGMTACEGFNINWGDGNGTGTGTGTGNSEEKAHELVNCWHLVVLNGAEVDVDIYIDFDNDGKFAIYQRTESLEFTVFNGTYTMDEENAIVSGVYNDGTSWLTSYNYVVNKENKTLTLTSTENPSEVAVYEESEVPASATANTRSASVDDVKPL